MARQNQITIISEINSFKVVQMDTVYKFTKLNKIAHPAT